MAEPGKDLELQAPSDAITAVAYHPTDPDRLLASSWDGTIHLYTNTSSADPSTIKVFQPSRAPAFDVCWGASGSNKIYSGGLDRNVIETDVETSTYRIIGTHNDAVRCVRYIESANCVVSASWDSTFRIHSLSSGTPISVTLPLPAKAFSMDTTGDKLVIAMAQRHVYIYNTKDFANPSPSIEPYQKRENSLKFMVRCVKCMPTGNGYACSSIEGRVAVEYYDMDSKVQKGHFAFKCHRQNVDNVDTVYPVNALAFHPQFGTFATGGADSVVAIWDPQAKKRLRQLPKYPASIASLSFNADGSKLAIACAVIEEEQPTQPGMKNALFVRRLGEDEARPKTKA